MAKISIVGNAAVFTSEMTLEGLTIIQKYRPGALKLMGGENNKETLFTIMVGGTIVGVTKAPSGVWGF